MKKPLIALVDDDPAVLEALDSTFRPEFEEICRVESFNDPMEVLGSVGTWEAERRPIALAIVDQKMPRMTGVDLIRSLRATTPATHMRGVLLTGYAGLDSAL